MKDKKFKKIAVGGTFDNFHKGHKKLLQKAFKNSSMVLIGVTSDEFGGLKGNIESYQIRKANLKEYVYKFNSNFDIIKIHDQYGPSIEDEEIDAIVVSVETRPTADEINKMREKKCMEHLSILVIEMVLADDGKPISSSRIREKEINKEGEIFDSS
jgi:cytidyltransferase-like protein